MTVDTRAGHPADPAALVDVERLLAAYHDVVPDPAVAGQRIAFGTSGHRGSSLRTSFNEAHILATSEAVVRYRRSRGFDGPLFLARDTHALSEPATRTALEVLVAGGVDVLVDTADRPAPTPALSHAILTHNRGRHDGLADGIVVTPSHNPPEDGGFKYNPPNGGPADTDVTGWIQEEANRLLEAGVERIERVPFERAISKAGRYDFVARYVDDLGSVLDMDAIRVIGSAHRGRPARGRIGRLLAGDRGALRPRPDRDERRRGPAIRVHDGRLGWAHPDGSVVALRHGAAGRVARSLRHRVRQRRRRRPPWDRHAVQRAAQPEPRPVGGGRLSVRRRPRLGPGRRRRQDARFERDDRPRHGRPGAALARGPGRVQVVRRRARRRHGGLRGRGECRGIVPAPRRDRVDHRQGRDHRVPARPPSSPRAPAGIRGPRTRS